MHSWGVIYFLNVCLPTRRGQECTCCAVFLPPPRFTQSKGIQVQNNNKEPMKIIYCQHIFLQLLVLDSEQLTTRPWEIAGEIQRFLGLDEEITKANFFWGKYKGFYCLRENSESGDVEKWCLGENKGRHHPKLKLDTERKLRDFFKPYNARFYDLVGHNFGWE